MIQTHFVRLEPPYQIIYCNGQVGIQIGTLIATEEKRNEAGEYGMVSHSHPVISYGDKRVLDSRVKNGTSDIELSPGEFLQGVVWDKAEAKDVTVLGLAVDGQKPLSPERFACMVSTLLSDKAKAGDESFYSIQWLYKALKRVNMAPTYKHVSEIDINMQVFDEGGTIFYECSDEEGIVQLTAPRKSVDQIVRTLENQVRQYSQLMPSRFNTVWKFHTIYGPLPENERPDTYEAELECVEVTQQLNRIFNK